MNDLFEFLKNLFRGAPEHIAAFVMGLVIAAIFFVPGFYFLFNRIYGNLWKKQKATDKELVDLKKNLAEAEQKARERRAKVVEKEGEAAKLNAKMEARDQETVQLKKRETELLDNLHEARDDLQNTQAQLSATETKLTRVIAKAQEKYKSLYSIAQQKIKYQVDQSTSLKKQIASLSDQAKLAESLQGQLWDVPVDQDKTFPFRPLRKDSAVIIAVTNLKGGVGKTTLTANIAATYARTLHKRVLLVDLDFQASLTNLSLPAELVGELTFGSGKLIDNLFQEMPSDAGKTAFANVAHTQEPKLHLLGASENLALLEERSKARWLSQPGHLDLRCVLRSALHAPIFQDNFDVILIDCPPRWTTSSINAIACCDYVLIPTQLDRVSSEAVPRLLAWLRDLRSKSAPLFGQFEILGVIGNRAYPREALIAQERTIWEALPEKCKKAWGMPIYHFDTIIRDKNEIRRAADHREFAALIPALQPIFLNLAKEIETRRSAHEGR